MSGRGKRVHMPPVIPRDDYLRESVLALIAGEDAEKAAHLERLPLFDVALEGGAVLGMRKPKRRRAWSRP